MEQREKEKEREREREGESEAWAQNKMRRSLRVYKNRKSRQKSILIDPSSVEVRSNPESDPESKQNVETEFVELRNDLGEFGFSKNWALSFSNLKCD